MTQRMLVFEPVAVRKEGPQQSRQPLDGLAGKVIGFIDNAKPNFNYLVDDLAGVLVAKYGVAKVVKRRKRGAAMPVLDSVVKELSEQCDAVITESVIEEDARRGVSTTV